MRQITHSPRRDGADQIIDWDLAFPDDERDANPATFKFFQAAQSWQKAAAGTGGGLSYDMPDSDDEDDENEEDAADPADGEDAENVADGVNGGAVDGGAGRDGEVEMEQDE